MLKIGRYGEVTQIMMGRELDGTVLYWTAAYLVDGLLVDTGCAYTAAELVEYLRSRKVEQVVNTHHHEDHIGANSIIRQQLGPGIYAHLLALPLINKQLPLREYQETVWGYPELSTGQAVPERIITTNYIFEVLETPGHSPDHISLYEAEQGWLFSGDLFVSEKYKALRADEDIETIIASLDKVQALPQEKITLFTSIGKVFPEGKKVINNYLAYLSDLRKKVAWLADESLTAVEIRDRIFGCETQLAALTGGHFAVLNLIKQLMPRPGNDDCL